MCLALTPNMDGFACRFVGPGVCKGFIFLFIYHVTDIVHEIGIVASGQVTIEYIDLWGNKAIMSNITRDMYLLKHML